MNSSSFRTLRGHLCREVITPMLFYGMLLQSAMAAAPGWWSTQGVITPNKPADDYAALNQGQLKNFVRAAVYELHAKLPGGAGTLLNNLLHTWRTQQLNADDYAAVTVGQLKAVAKPVYASMQAAGLPLPVPWTALTTDDDDYAAANIGQAKHVFAFVVPDMVTLGKLDSDGDGFSDALELALGTNPYLASSRPGGSGDVSVNGGGGSGGGTNGGSGGNGGGGGLPPYVDPYPEPWPDFDAAGTAAADKDTDNDGVKDAQDQVWYDPAFKGQRSGVPHYNIIDLGKCEGGFLDMADNGALLWADGGGYKVWTPEHPAKREIPWDPNAFGLEDGSWGYLTGIRNDGVLVGGGLQEITHTYTIDHEQRLFTYTLGSGSSTSGSAAWLPRFYPADEGDRKELYWLGYSHTLGPGSKEFGDVMYRVYPPESNDGKTWTAFYRLAEGGAQFEDQALARDYPPLPEEPPDPSEYEPGDTQPLSAPGYINEKYSGATSGTGAVRTQRRMKLTMRAAASRDLYDWMSNTLHWEYDWDYTGTYPYSEPVYEEDVWTYTLVTASGSQVLKTRDAVAENHFSAHYFNSVSAAAHPWVSYSVDEYAETHWWDAATLLSTKSYLYTPDENGGNYQKHPIYASRKDYQAAQPIKHIGLLTAQNQALVWGEFDADHAGKEMGLWADGEVQLMSKIISGYDRYTDWYFADVSKDGMLAATAWKQGAQGLEPHMLLLIPITTHEVKEDGTLAASGGGVQASMPSPVFCDSVDADGKPQGQMSCALNNLRVLGDGSVVGDLQVSGKLASKACDNVKGTKGTITQAQLWVNGADAPQAVITVTPSKQNTGSAARPYPYAGTFSTTIANVPLTGGNNVFKFTAEDPVYHMPGYSTWAVTINVTDPEEDDEGGGGNSNPDGNFALTVQLPAATLAAGSVDTISATLNLDGTAHTNVPLTETAAASGVFSGVLADGRPARLMLTGTAALSAATVDVLDSTLLLGAPGSASTYRSGVRETGPASGVFTGGYVSSSIASTGGSGAGGVNGSNPTNTGGSNGNGGAGAGTAPAVTVSADPYEGMLEVEKSNGGEFHRFAISVGVSEALKEHFKMAFGEGNDAEEFELMKDAASGLMVLKDPQQSEGDVPFTPAFKSSEASPNESDAEHAKRMEEMHDVNFAKGFACGVGYGGVDMVTGAGKLIAGVAEFGARGLAGIGLGFTWVSQWARGEDTFDTESMIIEIGTPNAEVVDQGVALAEFLEPLLTAPVTMLPKIAWGFYTGDQALVNTAMFGSESHRIIFQMACEAILETKKDWEDGTEGQKGYITGRIVFEVASIVIPAGTAGRLVSKLEVLAHLKQTKLFKAGARAVMAAKEAALAINRMCFEANTKVKTQGDERINIQDVHADMAVWSRDEASGKECLKRVVQTFTTHPTELYRLTYEVRGPPGGGPLSPRAESETLGVTAPHPFWVCNNEPPGFIAAEDLRVGDMLHVGAGKEAVVTRKVLEPAPPGETFTTYNFEVQDYHTYFVGDAGVWVHNASPRSCQEALDMFENLLERLNNNITSAWLKTSQAIAIAKMEGGSLLQLKFFTEVRPKWLANLANSVPPWLNTAIQHLPAGVKGSAGRLRANMEKVLGITKPKGMASHHIVEKLDNPAAREILEEAGIHIDEAANGVWLPRQKMIDEFAAKNQSNWLDGLGPRHEGSHSPSYSDAVFERLRPLRGQPPHVIRNTLQQIAKELIEGTFPWP